MASESNDKCYKGAQNWENVTLEEFMDCKSNFANNRQTRMLALFDSKFEFCPSSMEIGGFGEELLERAKKTLNSLFFFAINEKLHLSIKLFEKKMDSSGLLFRFKNDVQNSNNTIAGSLYYNLNSAVFKKIRKLNYLDVELYKYALKLFFEKVKYYKLE